MSLKNKEKRQGINKGINKLPSLHKIPEQTKKSQFSSISKESQGLPPLNQSQQFMSTYQMSPSIKYLQKPHLTPLKTFYHDKAINLGSKQINEQNIKTENQFINEDEFFQRQLSNLSENDQFLSFNNNVHNVGENAIKSFYNHYKQLDKVQQQEDATHLHGNIYLTNLLTSCEKFNLFPIKAGLVKANGEENVLDLSNYGLGDRYAQALAAALKNFPQIEDLRLKNNRLSKNGANALIETLVGAGAKNIDLSYNNIGKESCENLKQLMYDIKCGLLYINLEHNKLTDKSIIQICEALKYNISVQKLRLSNNNITDVSCVEISNMLNTNKYLTELYLDWNQIKANGGALIIDGLIHNNEIRVIDLSWNSIGSKSSLCSDKLAQYFQSNQYLVHIDISHNKFNAADTQKIAEGLNKNSVIYGVHYAGNQGVVDSKGFIHSIDSFHNSVQNFSISSRMQGVNCLRKKEQSNLEQERFLDKCWICEGWTEQEFEWLPNISGEEQEDPIFIHFEFENYMPIYIPNQNGKFQLKKMCPPGKIKYFYTVNENQVADENTLSIINDFPDIKNIEYISGEKQDLFVPKVNLLNNHINYKVINQHYEPTVSVKPRLNDPEYIPPKLEYQKPKWQFGLSVFKDYKSDNEEILQKCFETDWSCCKISKFVSNQEDLQKLKEYFRSIYKKLREAYKYYSTIGVVDDVWSIGSNTFTELINSSGMIDGKNLVLSDVDRKFIATNSSSLDIKAKNNPEKSLIRFQLMEVLVRIADRKYIESGETKSFYSATTHLFQDHVYQVIDKFDSTVWRLQLLWVESCDIIFKAYLPILNIIYKQYSGLKTPPGKPKFICLDEFQKLSKDLKLHEEANFVERDFLLAFNLSIMTQIDEIYSSRHLEMYFFEFLEAIARIADKYSPLPFGANTQDYSLEQRQKLPLPVKLEGFMQMLKELINYQTLERIFIPAESVFEGESFELKKIPIHLKKEKGGQAITQEFNKKSLKDLKLVFSIEDKFF